jgi:hypothetical protein
MHMRLVCLGSLHKLRCELTAAHWCCWRHLWGFRVKPHGTFSWLQLLLLLWWLVVWVVAWQQWPALALGCVV